MSTPKTKREKLHEYLTRPETPEDIKAAWLELNRHVATLTRDLQMEMLRNCHKVRAGEEG